MLPQLLFKELKAKAGMPEDDFEDYCQLFEPLTIGKHEFVFKPGDIAGYILFVGKGCVHIYAEPVPGARHTLYFAEEGWWTGDLVSMRNQTETDQYFEATEDCEFLIITRDNWNYALRRFSWFATFHLEAHGKWLAKLSKQLEERRSKTPLQNLEQMATERQRLLQRLPDECLASYLGVSVRTAMQMKADQLTKLNT